MNKNLAGKQKSTENQLLNEYAHEYLTRGEIALCCIAKIQIATFLTAKMSFVSNGYIITNQILALLDWRPGIAEVMAYICLALFN